jgi:sugar lactone lactonase YvrE
LAVDSTGTLFIGDCPLYPNSCGGAIYTLASGAPTPQPLTVTGLPAQYFPSALLRDSSSNLYIADNGETNPNGGVYVAPAAGGAAQPVSTGSFILNGPSGLVKNATGDLYILSFLGANGATINPGQQVVIIPAASPTTPYILPNTNLGLANSAAFDPNGNLDVLESFNGQVSQLSSPNPVNLGSIINVGATGTPVQFNFEYNAPVTLRGFQIVTQGDVSTEVIQSNGGTCTNGNHTNLGLGGQAISAYFPYTCTESFYGSPRYPGVRSSAIQVKGPTSAILASTPVYQTGFAGVQVTYPLDETTTATGLQQPQAVAISGLNQTVYVSDSAAGKVYSTGGLGGTALTPVSTGTVKLTTPLGLALDGAGNLFIVDYDGAQVIEVPTTTGLAPSVVNTGGLLQHPLNLAFDYVGNLYIGDAGPAGINASTAEPGYIVKVPVGGAPFKMTIPANVQVVFPQALVTDPYTAALLIGDAGDPSVGVGQIIQLYPNGTAGSGVIPGVISPSGLAFDQAEQLYVLDSTTNTITVIPGPTSTQPIHLLPFDNSMLIAATGFASSAGGQSFIIANIGAPNNSNLVRLNGNRSTLAFGNVKVGSQSQPQTATVYNIGNLNMTLASPYYTTNGANAAFSILGSTQCDNGNFLAPSWSCNIDVEFIPQVIGLTTQQLTVKSDGYNGGSSVGTSPVLVLRGTGTAAGSVKRKK